MGYARIILYTGQPTTGYPQDCEGGGKVEEVEGAVLLLRVGGRHQHQPILGQPATGYLKTVRGVGRWRE